MINAKPSAASPPDLKCLIVQQQSPFNAEPDPGALVADHVTPQAIFYVRSHGDVPLLGEDHAVMIGDRTWNQATLERAFPRRSVAATLQCAGNRRADMQHVAKTKGDPWGVGAIGNAVWTGVSLIDVLREAGLDNAEYVHFTAADEVSVEGEHAPYGVSISMEKARDPNVLIAWAMNDELLAPDHGAPLRLIVPGFAGVRSIKWLSKIAVADTPSAAPIQARDYKLFPATVRSAEEAVWENGLTIETLPVNAALCSPCDGAQVEAGDIRLRGYAMAYGRGVARVEVSIDDGKTWAQAVIDSGNDAPSSWVRWACDVELAKGKHDIVVRAVDTAGQGQPEHPGQVWNFAGYLATSWHRSVIKAS